MQDTLTQIGLILLLINYLYLDTMSFLLVSIYHGKLRNITLFLAHKASFSPWLQLLWIIQLLIALKFGDAKRIRLCCDNQAALCTTSIRFFMKHLSIYVACQFIWVKRFVSRKQSLNLLSPRTTNKHLNKASKGTLKSLYILTSLVSTSIIFMPQIEKYWKCHQ